MLKDHREWKMGEVRQVENNEAHALIEHGVGELVLYPAPGETIEPDDIVPANRVVRAYTTREITEAETTEMKVEEKPKKKYTRKKRAKVYKSK